MKIVLACILAVALASAYYLARSGDGVTSDSMTTYYAAQHLKPASAQAPEMGEPATR
jgi:hypothetical protein